MWQEAQLGLGTKAVVRIKWDSLWEAVMQPGHTVDAQQTHEFSSHPRGSPIFLTFSGRKLGFEASLFLTCANLA